ncbi:GST N 2 domain containing protein [Asbolus verrucosus]|uniref:GST N 2 domain containing protein n=1 Tax=Asbolus verrucosus TaxID=1661398 RepID=A0A482WE03_ASBVE|nr:GST N 2 domain containing protein [Asbolus verrucosus]
MAPTLYMIASSPPVRAVLMTSKSIGLNLDLKQLDLSKGEHKTPEFLKLNPQHTVPTLVDDDGFVIWDSHAIMPYLLSKYGKDDSLYPKDPQKRAIVDQRLHFESGVVFASAVKILYPIIYQGKKTIDQKDLDVVAEIYSLVEVFLQGKRWIAGDSVTIADYSLIASVTSLDVLHKIDPSKCPNLTAWLKRAETLPVYDANKVGLEAFAAFITSLLA